MAREYAQIKLSIWADDKFRGLTVPAQHLYMLLLTHASLSHCGVADWRPRRLAAMSIGWGASDVDAAGKELAEANYLVIDEDTEEVLVRSFMRNDGLMRNPKMAVAVSIAHAGVASQYLRQVIIHELIRLHDENPEWSAWKLDRVSNLLQEPSGLVIGSVIASGTGSPIGEVTASGTTSPAPTPAPTPATTKSTSSVADAPAKKPTARKTKMPNGWWPTDGMARWARDQLGPSADLKDLTENFIDHHAAKGTLFVDWNRAWQTWVRNDRRFHGSREVSAPSHIWNVS